MATPSSRAKFATSALVVSIDSGTRTRPPTARSTGRSRASSSATLTGVAPGLVDSAPMSMMSAPAASIACTASMARAGSEARPSAENESDVRLSTPITSVRDPSSRGGRPGSGMRKCARGDDGKRVAVSVGPTGVGREITRSHGHHQIFRSLNQITSSPHHQINRCYSCVSGLGIGETSDGRSFSRRVCTPSPMVGGGCSGVAISSSGWP